MRFSSAKIGQRPRRVPKESFRRSSTHFFQQRRHRAGFEQNISQFGGVAGDVSERPHDLLLHLPIRRLEEADEVRRCAGRRDEPRVDVRTGRDVSQRPRRFELMTAGG